MSSLVYRQCLYVGSFLMLLCFGLLQLSAQELQQGQDIDVEEYVVEAELRPDSQELWVKATIKFKTRQGYLSQVILDFNGNLTANRIYLTDKLQPTGSLLKHPIQKVVISKEKEVPYLSRKKEGRRSSKAVRSSMAPDSNLLLFHQQRDEHLLEVNFPRPLQIGQVVTLVVEYGGSLSSSASPVYGIQTARLSKDMCYLLAMSRWFPMNGYQQDRAKGTFRLTVPRGYLIAMEGELTSREQLDDQETFTFVSRKAGFPGSLAAAAFNEITIAAGQVEIKYYIMDNKRDYVDAHTEVVTQLLDLYSEKFSPYPLQTFKIVVVDNESLLAFSAPGIEFLADRAFGVNPNTNLLAKEIAYQWWAFLVSPKTEFDLWLKEGFSAYSALLYQESISSEAGFARELKDVAVAALLYEDESSILNAYQLDLYSPEYNSVLKSKGAYVLHMLRGVIGQKKLFDLLKQYVYNFGYQQASVGDFKALAEKISEKDLGYFFSQWIEQSGVPEFEYEFTTLRIKDGFRVDGVLRQDLDLFKMPVEIRVETDGDSEIKQIEVMGPESRFSVTTLGKPLTATIDPYHRVLRVSNEIRLATFIAKGDELRRLGEYTDAISQYQKAIEFRKRSSLAFYRLGEVYFEQRSTQSSANSFREALNGDLEPQWIEVWCYINLGKLFDMAGQRERALNEYQKALDTNDNTQGAQKVTQKYIEEPYKYEGRQLLVR